MNDVEQKIISLSIRTAVAGGAILILAAIAAIVANKKTSKKTFKLLKLPLFLSLAATSIIATLILGYNTVHLNVISESRGPVHWHADIEFWACGSEINLRDPSQFLSNKVGTSTYHEHNDKRIHLEGVVVNKSRDASLGKFMEVTGGFINDQGVGIPINPQSSKWFEPANSDGDTQSMAFGGRINDYVGETPEGKVLDLQNSANACGYNSKLQVFVYKYDKANKTYSQHKLTNPAGYVIRGEAIVPPGDCIIVEYDSPKDSTDKLCRQYGIRDSKRCVEFGVENYDPDLCNIRYEGVM